MTAMYYICWTNTNTKFTLLILEKQLTRNLKKKKIHIDKLTP